MAWPPTGTSSTTRSVSGREVRRALGALRRGDAAARARARHPAGVASSEVGAGGASVPAWLAEQAGADGFVLATDIDPSWVDGVAPAGVEVRRHDVAQDDPAEGGFDLVHARLVLTHVPDRGEALRRMAAALRPGGHLLVEDFDIDLQPLACPHATGPEHARAERIRAGFVALLVDRGVDRRFARTLPASMRALGLTDVRADASFPLADLRRLRSRSRTSSRSETALSRRATRPLRRSTRTSSRSAMVGSTSPCHRSVSALAGGRRSSAGEEHGHVAVLGDSAAPDARRRSAAARARRPRPLPARHSRRRRPRSSRGAARSARRGCRGDTARSAGRADRRSPRPRARRSPGRRRRAAAAH